MYKSSLLKELKEINTKPVNKEKINNLILNYLITEGYESAACDFIKESGIPIQEQYSLKLSSSVESIEKLNKLLLFEGFLTLKQRSDYKKLIFNGDVSRVIESLNLEYPFLLDRNNLLYFKIMLLHLVEIVKKYQREVSADGVLDVHKSRGTDSIKRKRRMSSISSDKKKHRRKSSTSAVLLNPEQLQKEKQLFEKITCVINEKIFPRILNNDYFLKELEWVMSLLLLNSMDIKSNNLPKELIELIENDNLKNEVFNMINNSIRDYDSCFIPNRNDSSLLTRGNINSKKSGLSGRIKKINNKKRSPYNFYQDSDSDEEQNDHDGDDIIMNSSQELNNSGKIKQTIDQDLLRSFNPNQDYEETLSKEMILKRTLNNNMNSNFKKFLNLWIWSENQRKNYGAFDDILHTDFEQLL